MTGSFRSLVANSLRDRELPKGRCLVIGEVAQTHDGSLGLAHAFIDAIAATGADAVKFQTHIAAAESTPEEPWRVKFSRQDATRYDYWKRMEFTETQWKGLKEHAHEQGLLFLSSPFSMEAAAMLQRVGVAAWKVASGEVNNPQMFDFMLKTALPFIISTGMSTISEIDRVVELVEGRGNPFALMQCTSVYPCPPEQVGLNLITFFRDRYGCAVGLSDHSGTIYPGLAAATIGIEVLEVHVALSREMFGPDVAASVTTAQLRQLVDGIRFIDRMIEHPVSKDAQAEELAPMRDLFTKSIVARMDIQAGTLLSEEHLTLKKPGTGLPANHISSLIGSRLRKTVKADEFLRIDDFESES